MNEIPEASNSESVGILSQEQQAELDLFQANVAQEDMDYLAERKDGDLFPLTAMATGIGKGRIIHLIIEKTVRDNMNSKILVIVGTKLSLVGQTQEALEGYSITSAPDTEQEYSESEETDALTEDTEEVDTSTLLEESSFLYRVVDYKRRNTSDANVHAATIQTIQSESANNRINPDDYDLVIVDESHNIGTRARVETIKKFKNVIGFTATAYRHTGALLQPEQYGFVVKNSLTLPEAQEKGWLPPLLETAIDTSHLIEEIPTTLSGQIDYKKLEKLLKDSPDLRPFIADELVKHISGENKPKTIVAVNFVWEADELAKLLKEKGISVGVAVNQNAAKAIDSEEIPALDSIRRYKLSSDDPESIQVLISPYVAAEGFDAPATEVLVWASPTDSTVRYTQFTGRTARRYPGKTHGTVIDFLYQTSQFNWSYNFGQWMKDSVIQLPNGMLFQGSRRQLERLTQLPEFTKITNQNGPEKTISISELQKSAALLDLQENDFPITETGINGAFIGGGIKLKLHIESVLEQISKENPELITQRKSGGNIITVVTDRDLFIQKMEERNVRLKTPVEEIKEGEFVISNTDFQETFYDPRNAFILAQDLIEEIRKDHPELVVQRKRGTHILTVITNAELFKQRMLEKGVRLKTSITEMQEGDFPISNKNFQQMFIGDYSKLGPIAEEVIEEIRTDHPELIAQRRSGSSIITVVTDRDLFIQKMEERNVRLKTPVEEIKEGELAISNMNLYEIFSGGQNKLSRLAKEVFEEIRKDHPEIIRRRRNGTHTIEVITDRTLFIQKMREKGVRLKTPLLTSLENDFVVTYGNVRDVFIGDDRKLQPMAQEIFEEIRRDHPELVVQRRSGNYTVDAITDKDLFIRMMQERGIKLRSLLSEVQETDFALTHKNLADIFIGDSDRLMRITNEVLGELRSGRPELITKRQSGKRIVDTITDKDLFIRMMQERGEKLRTQ